MMRFSPDSFWEAVLRPFAMALPQSWVYTEVMAPDMRFAFALLLGIVLLPIFRKRAKPEQTKRAYFLFAIVFLAFVPWLLTGGNGRYFMPFMLVVGVLCISLVWNAPLSMAMKSILTISMFGMQGFVISINSPWLPFDSIEWSRWQGREYIELNGDPLVMAEEHVTYVSFTGQTYSFLAPRFPSSSRWMNLISFSGSDFNHPDRTFAKAKHILATSKKLKLIVKAQPRGAEPLSGLPSALVLQGLNKEVKGFGLKIPSGAVCSLLRSSAMVSGIVLTSDTPEDLARIKAQAGFWICPLVYDDIAMVAAVPMEDFGQGQKAIQKIEALCPRLFPPGQKNFKRQSFGLDRGYSESDSNLMYAISDGKVYVKFMRALNPQLIGSADDILSPTYKLDCGKFTSREGLPWLRGV